MVGGVEVDVDVSFSVAVWSGGGVVVVVTESAASMLWCFGFWADFWAEETLLELFRFENVYNGCCMVDLIDDMNDVLFDLVFKDVVAAAAVAVLVDVGFFLSDVDDDDEDELDLSMSLLSSVTAMLSPDESVWWWLWWLNKFWMSLEPDDKRLVFDEDDDAVIVW